jgi:nucleoside-diphosphate-sugar epimerase
MKGSTSLRSAEEERFLVTGGQGFIGAWIAREIAASGAPLALLDIARDDAILEQVLEPDVLASVARFTADITDGARVERAIEESGATRVIHLAGLQVPTCRADPIRGAQVNVIGSLNVFEAVRRSRGRVRSIVYASSAAVAGPPEDYSGPIPDDAPHAPRTHYGVFKRANEGNALVYWLDHGIPSAGLRPLAVYGVGREVGITSGPTKAIKAALLGREYEIGFTGATGFHYVEDVASAFIGCARAKLAGARAFNMRGENLSIDAFIRAIDAALPGARARIRAKGPPIPIASDFDARRLDEVLGESRLTPVEEGVRRTVERFRTLAARGKLGTKDLDT